MSEKSEKRMLGLLQTLLDKVDSLERKLDSRNGTAKLPTPDEEARLWTPKDVLRKFGLGLRQQYNLRKSGDLPYVQKYERGPVGYLPPDVIGYFLGDTTP